MQYEKFHQIVSFLKENNLYPHTRTIDGSATDPEIKIGNKKYLMFCSYNYLGIANNKEIEEATIKAIGEYRIQPGGSRLVSGTQDIHIKLEQRLAKFKDTEDSIIFTNGMATNIGVVSAIMSLPKFSMSFILSKLFKVNEGCILSDELNHASIIDGCRLAKSDVVVYKHKDMSNLNEKLKSVRRKLKLIVTDGVFSMDGDIVPLPELIELSKKYNALLMVDDAHSTGVLGKHGKGTLEHYNMTTGIDLQMGTLSKAIGVLGGFICASQDIIDYLRVSARTYIFSGALPGPLASGTIKAIDIVENSYDLRKKLWANSDHLRSRLHELGLNTFESESPTPIIPVYIANNKKAIKISDDLFERKIFASTIRWPAVPRDKTRIRITLMASHTKDQIDYLVQTLKELHQKYNFNV